MCDPVELAKMVPQQAVDNLVVPASKEGGKTLALIPRAINAALLPLEKWILHREYSLEETKKLLAQKLKDVPEEKIVSPEPYVAVPALQAISYCMDSEELREMFANLLATAMNADTKDDAHPAFVEIIKQLSPLDAKILKHFNTLENRLLPLCQIRVQKYSPSKNVDLGIGPHPFKDMTEGFDVLSNFLIIDEISSESKLIATSFDNLNRLGIVFPKHGHTLSDINKYKPFISHPTVLKYLDEFEQKKSTDAGFTEGKEVVLIRSLFRITDFGISLFKAIL